MLNDVLIEARRITKRYGRRVALRELDFAVPRGRVIGIVGENGSGKSTLLQILAGLLPPTSGSVERKCVTGYCPQELLVFDSLTVIENLSYFARACGLKAHDFERRVAALLEVLQLAKHRDQVVAELSGGSKQKLNLIIALLNEPDLLLLDEPCSGLDWETYLSFWRFAHQARGDGKSVVIVSHLVHEKSYFDDIFSLRDGAISR